MHYEVWLEKRVPHEPVNAYHHNLTGEDNADPVEREFWSNLPKAIAYKEIADRMKSSIATVRSYVRTVGGKLRVHPRTGAVVKYLRARE